MVWKYYKKTEPLYSLASKRSQEARSMGSGSKGGYVDLPRLQLKSKFSPCDFHPNSDYGSPLGDLGML